MRVLVNDEWIVYRQSLRRLERDMYVEMEGKKPRSSRFGHTDRLCLFMPAVISFEVPGTCYNHPLERLVCHLPVAAQGYSLLEHVRLDHSSASFRSRISGPTCSPRGMLTLVARPSSSQSRGVCTRCDRSGGCSRPPSATLAAIGLLTVQQDTRRRATATVALPAGINMHSVQRKLHVTWCAVQYELEM